ncbi:uncharacterized, partial [Tachysurus ichikawai]
MTLATACEICPEE